MYDPESLGSLRWGQSVGFSGQPGLHSESLSSKQKEKKNQVWEMALNKQVFQLYLMCFSDTIYSGGEVMAAEHKEQEID